MSNLGWRSWLVVSALLLWLLAGAGCTWLVWAANAGNREAWLLGGVPLAGLLLPLVALAMVPPATRPPGLPAGPAFARSRWRLAWNSSAALILWGFALLLLPIGVPLLTAAARDALTAADLMTAAISGTAALAISLLTAVLLVGVAAAQWLMLKPAWARRRWPFAVLGPDRLWIDGHELPWRDIRQLAIRWVGTSSVLALDCGTYQVAIPLFALAGGGKALHDAIHKRLAGEIKHA